MMGSPWPGSAPASWGGSTVCVSPKKEVRVKRYPPASRVSCIAARPHGRVRRSPPLEGPPSRGGPSLARQKKKAAEAALESSRKGKPHFRAGAEAGSQCAGIVNQSLPAWTQVVGMLAGSSLYRASHKPKCEEKACHQLGCAEFR